MDPATTGDRPKGQTQTHRPPRPHSTAIRDCPEDDALDEANRLHREIAAFLHAHGLDHGSEGR